MVLNQFSLIFSRPSALHCPDFHISPFSIYLTQISSALLCRQKNRKSAISKEQIVKSECSEEDEYHQSRWLCHVLVGALSDVHLCLCVTYTPTSPSPPDIPLPITAACCVQIRPPRTLLLPVGSALHPAPIPPVAINRWDKVQINK